MPIYCVLYRDANLGTSKVEADTIQGADPSEDCYIFRKDKRVVAIFPKSVVLSITIEN